MRFRFYCLPFLLASVLLTGCRTLTLEERVEQHYVDNDGVNIHYVALGKEGPLIVMLHGFPDYWYSWRRQLEALSDDYRVVALDMRGYNLSGKPAGVDNYTLPRLVEDVAAVIHHQGYSEAVIMGHDWGGVVGWNFAMTRPEMTQRLIILNVPHPRALSRELANNPKQRRVMQFARNFQRSDAHLTMTSRQLAHWVVDPDAHEKYVRAFNNSDFEAMLNYYKANFPDQPYEEDVAPVARISDPVLLICGLDDPIFVDESLNDTWKWVEKDLTIVTIPGSSHFVHHDAAILVNSTIQDWLAR